VVATSDVELAQDLGHLVEAPTDIIGLLYFGLLECCLAACYLDELGDASFLFGEEVGPQPVVVVAAQQLPALYLKFVDCVRRSASGPSTGLGAGSRARSSSRRSSSLSVALRPPQGCPSGRLRRP
jgi:hypothetical protein